jgi:hypothetical protein
MSRTTFMLTASPEKRMHFVREKRDKPPAGAFTRKKIEREARKDVLVWFPPPRVIPGLPYPTLPNFCYFPSFLREPAGYEVLVEAHHGLEGHL